MTFYENFGKYFFFGSLIYGQIRCIHAFNKSGRHLEFSTNDVIEERSYTWPKWLPKMKALLTLILQYVHVKSNVFTLYQEEYFLYVFMGMLL